MFHRSFRLVLEQPTSNALAFPLHVANIIHAYALFAKWANIEFIIPRINLPQKLPFIPTEREIDDPIAGCTRYIATFLQLCKETDARAGEIGALTWTDIDLEKATVRVAPEKGSNPRIQKLSPEAIQMLSQLARNHSTIFLGHYKSVINLRGTFDRQRKRIAAKLEPPTFANTLSHATPLESNNRILQNEEYPTSHAISRTQTNSKHAEVHAAGKVRGNRRLHLQSRRDERRDQCSDRGRL